MLKISARGEYALRFVRYLLSKPGSETLANVAKETAIPESLLRKVASELQHAGIVLAISGRNGGVSMARREISVYEVLAAVGEDLSLALCTSDVPCDLSASCSLGPLIRNLQRWIDTILKITRL